MRAMGKVVSRHKKWVILLGRLTENHGQLCKIIGKIQRIDLLKEKRMLRNKFERIERK